jgi:ribonuclease VapC
MIVFDSSAPLAILFKELEKQHFQTVLLGGDRCVIFAVALDRYGKGIDPKARLNLCDCAAYALAKTMNSSLLFKGNDFAATDVRAVI